MMHGQKTIKLDVCLLVSFHPVTPELNPSMQRHPAEIFYWGF
jgi:hypothetical protein